MPICSVCKGELPEGACFCGYCGSRVEQIAKIPEKRAQVIAPAPALGTDPESMGTAETMRAEQPEEMVKTLVQQRAPVEVPQPEIEVPPPEVVIPQPEVEVVLPLESLDNRQFERYPLRVDITLSSPHNFFTGDSENISRGGLFVATHTPEPVGQRLEVTFTLPGLDLPSTVPCEVRWVREGQAGVPGMGLRFLQIDRETEAAIDAFLTHREPILRDEV